MSDQGVECDACMQNAIRHIEDKEPYYCTQPVEIDGVLFFSGQKVYTDFKELYRVMCDIWHPEGQRKLNLEEAMEVNVEQPQPKPKAVDEGYDWEGIC